MAVASAPTGLARAAARGAVWSYATFVVTKGLFLVSTLVLARLLAPEDFGLVALALVVTNVLDVLNDFGIISAVIWHGADHEHTCEVAFGLDIAVGVVLTVSGLLVAPLVAAGYGQPRVAPLFATLSVTFLIASFGSVQDARLRRALDFRRRFVAELAKALTKSVVTIVLAVAGMGAWSLVHGQVAGVAAGAISYWILARWRPRLAFDRGLSRRLLSYGSQITSIGVLAVAASNVDYIAIGRRLGAVQLGYYTLAFRLPALLVLNGCSVLSQVVFPVFAKVTHENGSLRRALLRAVRALAALTLPLGVGIACVAPDLISVLFGDRWAPAVPVMRWLAVYTVVSTLLYNDGDVYKTIGRPSVLNFATFVQLLVAIPVLWWAAGSDINTVAMGQVVVAGSVLALRLVLVRIVLAVRVADLAKALWPVVVATAVLAGSVVAVQALLGGAGAPLRLLASVVAGAGAYAGALAVVDRRWTGEMMRLFALGRSGHEAPDLVPSGPA